PCAEGSSSCMAGASAWRARRGRARCSPSRCRYSVATELFRYSKLTNPTVSFSLTGSVDLRGLLTAAEQPPHDDVRDTAVYLRAVRSSARAAREERPGLAPPSTA